MMYRLPICLGISLAFGTTSLMAQERLTPEVMWQLGKLSEAKVSPDGKNLIYGVSFANIQENKSNRELFSVPVAGGAAKQLTQTPKSERNACWRPDGKKIGYLYDGQLWEMNPDGSEAQQLSHIDGGISEFLYAPNGKAILYAANVKIDKNLHDKYPDLPKTNAMEYDGLMYRHWDTYEDGEYSHVFLASYENGKVGTGLDIMAGEAYDTPLAPMGSFVEQVAMSPDCKTIAYTCKKMTGTKYALSTNSDIYLYNVDSKQTINITVANKGYDQNPVFSPDGKKIAYESMAMDGNEADKNRLAIYDVATQKNEYMTDQFDQDATNFNWSADAKHLYFISGVRATFQIYKMELASRKISQLTKGYHDYKELALAGETPIGVKQNFSTPNEVYRVDAKTGKEEALTFTNKSTLDKIKFGKVEERNITTTDGKKMLVWVFFPPNFDPNKKYPTLLYCQGGPQSVVSNFYSVRWNFHLMAANDYIIVAPNRRGLPTFGQKWNDEISGDWGGQCMRDYLTAIDTVSKEKYVDNDRLGAVGASFGGYSVFYLAGIHNKRFKTFIAHAGVFNFESMFGVTEETFFNYHEFGGPYWDPANKKSYEQFSPHKLVDKWDTPILIIHGEKDYRVPVSEGMQAFTAAQLKGIPSKFLVFPGENHWVTSAQNSILWHREFKSWLDQWLKAENK